MRTLLLLIFIILALVLIPYALSRGKVKLGAVKIMIVALSAVVAVGFFLPFASLAPLGFPASSFSALNMALGFNLGFSRVSGSFMVFGILIIPAIVIAAIFLSKNLKKGMIISLAAYGVYYLTFFTAIGSTRGVALSIGFFLLALLPAICMGLSAAGIFAIKKHGVAVVEQVSPTVTPVVNMRFCTECGEKLTTTNPFCSNCGAKQ